LKKSIKLVTFWCFKTVLVVAASRGSGVPNPAVNNRFIRNQAGKKQPKHKEDN